MPYLPRFTLCIKPLKQLLHRVVLGAYACGLSSVGTSKRQCLCTYCVKSTEAEATHIIIEISL